MNTEKESEIIRKYAVWAITPSGADLAKQIAVALKDADIYLSSSLESDMSCFRFERLSIAMSQYFRKYENHICIMATGIVVRVIAQLIQDKTKDPAVVVLDEKGTHCISLLSGHIGGANQLAKKIAKITNGTPVITTATDTQNIPAIDMIAKESGWMIENPGAIKTINMAFLKKEPVTIIDPYRLFPVDKLESIPYQQVPNLTPDISDKEPGIYIGDKIEALPARYLILRPKILVAGIGCNRNTPMRELSEVLTETLTRFGLSFHSISRLASIQIKADEVGLLELSSNPIFRLIFSAKWS